MLHFVLFILYSGLKCSICLAFVWQIYAEIGKGWCIQATVSIQWCSWIWLVHTPRLFILGASYIVLCHSVWYTVPIIKGTSPRIFELISFSLDSMHCHEWTSSCESRLGCYIYVICENNVFLINKVIYLQCFLFLQCCKISTIVLQFDLVLVCPFLLALLEAARKINFQDVLSRISAGFSSNR